MSILVIVETPRHQHFNDQEDKDSSDIVLHGQYVAPVLEVEKAPKDAQHKVYDRQASIERKLRNLRSWQLSKGVAKFYNGLELCIRLVWICAYTVVAGLRNVVVDSLRIL